MTLAQTTSTSGAESAACATSLSLIASGLSKLSWEVWCGFPRWVRVLTTYIIALFSRWARRACRSILTGIGARWSGSGRRRTEATVSPTSSTRSLSPTKTEREGADGGPTGDGDDELPVGAAFRPHVVEELRAHLELYGGGKPVNSQTLSNYLFTGKRWLDTAGPEGKPLTDSPGQALAWIKSALPGAFTATQLGDTVEGVLVDEEMWEAVRRRQRQAAGDFQKEGRPALTTHIAGWMGNTMLHYGIWKNTRDLFGVPAVLSTVVDGRKWVSHTTIYPVKRLKGWGPYYTGLLVSLWLLQSYKRWKRWDRESHPHRDEPRVLPKA